MLDTDQQDDANPYSNLFREQGMVKLVTTRYLALHRHRENEAQNYCQHDRFDIFQNCSP